MQTPTSLSTVTLILVRALGLPHPPSHSHGFRATFAKLDFTGMIMLMSTLSFLIVALNLGGQAFAWNSPVIIGMFCAAVVSFIAFVVAENYAKMPVAPLALFVQWQWRNVPLILG
jgi:Fungal trichothecene efflux pump (TRI12)